MFRVLPTMLAMLAGFAGCRIHADDTFLSNGVKISYMERGQGEPVILIHGWTSSGWINWTLPGTTGLLAKDHKVIVPDMPGHGRSDKPVREDAYGPELVEDVVRLMDHLKIGKAHIVGYSMGGIIAAKLIVRHPDRVLSGTLGGMGWLREGSWEQKFFADHGKTGSPQTFASAASPSWRLRKTRSVDPRAGADPDRRPRRPQEMLCRSPGPGAARLARDRDQGREPYHMPLQAAVPGGNPQLARRTGTTLTSRWGQRSGVSAKAAIHAPQ